MKSTKKICGVFGVLRRSLHPCWLLSALFSAALAGNAYYLWNNFLAWQLREPLYIHGLIDRTIRSMGTWLNLGTLGLAFLLPLVLFKYLYRREEQDFTHSLPLGKNALFWGKYLAGLVCLFIPLLLGYLLMFVLGLGIGIQHNQHLPSVLCTLAVHLLIALLVYHFALLIVVCSRTLFQTLDNMVLLTVLWPGFVEFASWVIYYTIPGTGSTGNLHPLMALLSPPAASMELFHNYDLLFSYRAHPLFYLWWAVLALLMLAGACWFFGHRRAGSTPRVSITVKGGLCVAVATLAALFGLVSATFLTNSSALGFPLAILLFVCTYILCRLIYFRRLKPSKRSVISGAVGLLLFFGFCTAASFGMGLDLQHPAKEDLASVQIESRNVRHDSQVSTEHGILLPEMTPEDMDKAFALQQALVADYRAKNYPYPIGKWNSWPDEAAGETSVSLKFTLDNGHSSYKSYVFSRQRQDLLDQANALTRSPQYVQGMAPIAAFEALSSIEYQKSDPRKWVQPDQIPDEMHRAPEAFDPESTPSDFMTLRTFLPESLSDPQAFRSELLAALISDLEAGCSYADRPPSGIGQEAYFLQYDFGSYFTATSGILVPGGTPAAGEKFQLYGGLDVYIYPSMPKTFTLLETTFPPDTTPQ